MSSILITDNAIFKFSIKEEKSFLGIDRISLFSSSCYWGIYFTFMKALLKNFLNISWYSSIDLLSIIFFMELISKIYW